MTRKSTSKTIGGLISLVLFVLAGWQFVEWTVNRIYVPPGQSLLLRYKGPLPFEFWAAAEAAPDGEFAAVSESGRPLQVGVLEQMKGPGRHFYCPLWWERTLVPDIVVKPRQVVQFTSRMGKPVPEGQVLVNGSLNQTDFKGDLRWVGGPGVYRVNPFAYSHRIIETPPMADGKQERLTGWVEIPTGYVGVVKYEFPDPERGIVSGTQKTVLPAGIYPVNPREQSVDVLGIGFGETSIAFKKQVDAQGNLILDEAGEPQLANESGGISFPSRDGFTVHMDFTAIWGVMPDQAAEAVKTYGSIEAIEKKVIIPQIESICRIKGSDLRAEELLIGESRQAFQVETASEFLKALEGKNVTLQTGLVRYIYIPRAVREPIQNKSIADELTLTRIEEEKTKKAEADLKKAEQEVLLAAEKTRAETTKLVAQEKALGAKRAAEIKAETQKLVAQIAKQTAELETQAEVMLAEAENNALKRLEEAKADRFRMAVEAFGSGDAFNQWVFAEGLPDDIDLHLLYAGEGTFWTDLKGFAEIMLGRQAAREKRDAQQKNGKLPAPSSDSTR